VVSEAEARGSPEVEGQTYFTLSHWLP
jgi:hypothetical protein